MNLNTLWQQQSPSTRRALYLIGVGLALVLGLSVLMPEPGARRDRGEHTIEHLLTDQDPTQATLQSLAAQVDALKSENQKLVRQIDLLRADQRQLAAEAGPSKVVQSELSDLRSKVRSHDRFKQIVLSRIAELEQNGVSIHADEIRRMIEEQRVSTDVTMIDGGVPGIIPMRPVEPSAQISTPATPTEIEAASAAVTSLDNPTPAEQTLPLNAPAEAYFESAPIPQVNMATSPAGAAVKNAPKRLTIRSIGSDDPQSSSITARVRALEAQRERTEDQEQAVGLEIPVGSLIEAVVITGLDAPTNQQTRHDPFPVLMRFKELGILPNRFTADVRECFLLASGYGDMSSERAYMRGETISCITEDGEAMEARFDSYAVGEDGKAGVRGRLVTKNGALIARALIAGFGSGLSEALNVSVVPVVANKKSDTVQFQDAFSPQALQKGAVGGVQSALDKIADYYLTMAENIVPVIEIDAGRVITFVVSQRMSLDKPLSG